MGSEHPLGRASIGHLERIRTVVEGLGREAGLTDTAAFARSWHILMKGSIVSAAEGDVDAARRARVMAERLIAAHRPQVPSEPVRTDGRHGMSWASRTQG
jgi:hypothetical protein